MASGPATVRTRWSRPRIRIVAHRTGTAAPGTTRGAGGEVTSDARSGPRQGPTGPSARVQPPADGDALPAGVRGGHGLQRVVGAYAAAGAGRRHRVPRAVRRLRRGRALRGAPR